VAGVAPSVEQDLPGVPFGKYRILRKLGQGGVGCVYEALLPGPLGFSKRVAIKRLRPAVVAQNPWLRDAMINEALIGGMLHHDNIVDVLEFDRAGPHYYIAMEYVDGLTLGEIIRICRAHRVLLPRFALIRLAIDVCRGLQHAHGLRGADGRRVELVHRDLKPSNIMVSRSGMAKILDFGIAKAASVALDTTTRATVKGTPRYMSPEQITGDRDLGPRSDLFSLASVLVELGTLQPAYQGSSMVSLALRIVEEDPIGLAQRTDRVVPGLGSILDRALRKRPHERYPSARAMAADLRVLARTYPSEADMAEVVSRLLPAVDRSQHRDVLSEGDIDRDASVLPLRHPTFDPEAESISSPTPASADWRHFVEAFELMQTADELDVDPEWLTEDDPASSQRLVSARVEQAPRPGWGGVLASFAGRIRSGIRRGADGYALGDLVPLPEWVVTRLTDEPPTVAAPSLPEVAIEWVGGIDDTGSLSPLPASAIEGLPCPTQTPTALPEWAYVEVHDDDTCLLEPLPDDAIAPLSYVPILRRAALLASAGLVVVLSVLAVALSLLP